MYGSKSYINIYWKITHIETFLIFPQFFCLHVGCIKVHNTIINIMKVFPFVRDLHGYFMRHVLLMLSNFQPNLMTNFFYRFYEQNFNWKIFSKKFFCPWPYKFSYGIHLLKVFLTEIQFSYKLGIFQRLRKAKFSIFDFTNLFLIWRASKQDMWVKKT